MKSVVLHLISYHFKWCRVTTELVKDLKTQVLAAKSLWNSLWPVQSLQVDHCRSDNGMVSKTIFCLRFLFKISYVLPWQYLRFCRQSETVKAAHTQTTFPGWINIKKKPEELGSYKKRPARLFTPEPVSGLSKQSLVSTGGREHTLMETSWEK